MEGGNKSTVTASLGNIYLVTAMYQIVMRQGEQDKLCDVSIHVLAKTTMTLCGFLG